MLLTEEQANARLESPNNLLARLRSATKAKVELPQLAITEKPTLEQLMPDVDEKIKGSLIRQRAAAIADKALSKLDEVIDSVEKPSQLSRIALDMDKIVNSELESGRGVNMPQIIVYAPQVVNEKIYDTITVPE